MTSTYTVQRAALHEFRIACFDLQLKFTLTSEAKGRLKTYLDNMGFPKFRMFCLMLLTGRWWVDEFPRVFKAPEVIKFKTGQALQLDIRYLETACCLFHFSW
jgi:hypothetical protein